MNYSDWLKTVPDDIRNDPLWNVEAYRLALFAAELGWHDVTKLFRDGRTLKLAAQLFDAVGSVGANISEGYSRGHQKDRARFYEYALGSARESRTWYFDSRHVLSEKVANHRIQLFTQIVKLLLSMVPSIRGYSLHEDDAQSAMIVADDFPPAPQAELTNLLNSIPMSDN